VGTRGTEVTCRQLVCSPLMWGNGLPVIGCVGAREVESGAGPVRSDRDKQDSTRCRAITVAIKEKDMMQGTSLRDRNFNGVTQTEACSRIGVVKCTKQARKKKKKLLKRTPLKNARRGCWGHDYRSGGEGKAIRKTAKRLSGMGRSYRIGGARKLEDPKAKLGVWQGGRGYSQRLRSPCTCV